VDQGAERHAGSALCLAEGDADFPENSRLEGVIQGNRVDPPHIAKVPWAQGGSYNLRYGNRSGRGEDINQLAMTF